ncbi:MAG: sulfate/molybdate ABC transporter ATP-binding protein [Dermatophilaceae bacterium]
MTLSVRARLGERGLDVELRLADGERLAVLGPNGAGKSTLLNVLAGLVRPDSGRAQLDDTVLFDLDRRRGPWVPPHERGVSMLAQDPLLFPRLTVSQNVAFGPRAGGQKRAQARRTAERWLAELGAAELADRKPGQLSGGQSQRVAIARALATEPRLLLLDEPLAALDVDAAPVLRRVLRQVLTGRSAILVTHELLDALLLSDQVLVLERGLVVESGPTAEVLHHPRTQFTARLAGLNMLVGLAEGTGVRQRSGGHVEGLASTPTVAGEPVVAVFSPDAVSVHDERPHGSPRNVLRTTVTDVEPRGERVRVRGTIDGGDTVVADLTPDAVSELDLYPGRAAFFAVKAMAVRIYPG